jgi:hypothetical protein
MIFRSILLVGVLLVAWPSMAPREPNIARLHWALLDRLRSVKSEIKAEQLHSFVVAGEGRGAARFWPSRPTVEIETSWGEKP